MPCTLHPDGQPGSHICEICGRAFANCDSFVSHKCRPQTLKNDAEPTHLGLGEALAYLEELEAEYAEQRPSLRVAVA